MNTFQEFLNSGILPRGMNFSFITLIPKVPSPSLVKDFRPISLINCFLKILSKVLTNRLSNVMGKLISPNQTGFMKGRQISEDILITNEIIHSIKNKQSEGIILKLDFEKAFDSVDWDFLSGALEGFGFGWQWINWLKSFFTSMKASVLVNGSPTDEFSFQRGLRQEDPLSPYLFNIVGEVFHVIMERAKELGLIQGIHLNDEFNNFSHLQFADDTILFLKPSIHNNINLKRVLQCF